MEKSDADFILQIADLLAQGRLTDPEICRSARKIALIGNSQKISQVAQFHRYIQNISQSSVPYIRQMMRH
jgi:hypothetical protein